jgi:hypothetical protein
MKRIVLASALVFAAPSFLGAAKAVPINPGQGVTLPVVTETENLVGFETLPFTFGSTSSPNRIVGDLNEAVYKEGGGSLDFAYQISLTSAGATGDVADFTVADVTGVTTDVGRTASLPQFLSSTNLLKAATRSSDGSTLTFYAPTPVAAGIVSDIAVVRTDATTFDEFGSVTVSNGKSGGIFGLSGTFEPIDPGVDTTASVPEPSTWAMMLIGFASLGLAGWRPARRRAAPAC